jgi:hypothetical protein
LTRCSGRNGKAGLWLLWVVHYNMEKYKAGSITEMTDGEMTDEMIRWQRKKEVEEIFGNALYTVKTAVSFRHSLRHRNSTSASVVSSVKTTLLSVKTTLQLSYRVLEMTL